MYVLSILCCVYMHVGYCVGYRFHKNNLKLCEKTIKKIIQVYYTIILLAYLHVI